LTPDNSQISDAQKMSTMHAEILVAPIDKVDTSLLDHLCSALTDSIGLACRIGNPLPLPTYAFDPDRGQYAAESILERLHAGTSERALGVADLDLYVPDLNFVFGLADRPGRRAVIALPRLRQSFYGKRDDDILFRARAVKEAIHELGHTYGLPHCGDPRCVMAFSNSLMDTDYKQKEFCPRCRQRAQWEKPEA
jgi:archaemetzincin